MFKRFKNWGTIEVERLIASNMSDTKMSHIWIAEVYSNETLGENNLLLSVTYKTKKQATALRQALKASDAKYKVEDKKIDFYGEFIL